MELPGHDEVQSMRHTSLTISPSASSRFGTSAGAAIEVSASAACRSSRAHAGAHVAAMSAPRRSTLAHATVRRGEAVPRAQRPYMMICKLCICSLRRVQVWTQLYRVCQILIFSHARASLTHPPITWPVSMFRPSAALCRQLTINLRCAPVAPAVLTYWPHEIYAVLVR